MKIMRHLQNLWNIFVDLIVKKRSSSEMIDLITLSYVLKVDGLNPILFFK